MVHGDHAVEHRCEYGVLDHRHHISRRENINLLFSRDLSLVLFLVARPLRDVGRVHTQRLHDLALGVGHDLEALLPQLRELGELGVVGVGLPDRSEAEDHRTDAWVLLGISHHDGHHGIGGTVHGLVGGIVGHVLHVSDDADLAVALEHTLQLLDRCRDDGQQVRPVGIALG